VGEPRVLVAYADSTGLDMSTAIEIAKEVAEVPGVEVDVRPLSRVASIRPYLTTYLGWLPTGAGCSELTRFFRANAALLTTRRIWGVCPPYAGGVRKAGGRRLRRLMFRRLGTRRSGDEPG
jgi:hypothetical protein